MEKEPKDISNSIVDNKERLRFETLLDNGEYAYIDYRWYHGNLALMHTVVPEDMQGAGIASQLAKWALQHAEEKKLKIMVYCPFISAYLKRHPEWTHLVNREYTRG